MDLVYNYMPDVYSYQAARHPATSYDYWINDTAKKDCYRGNKKKQTKKDPTCSGKSARDNCPICQERQRRPLATYIRSKSREEKKLDASIEEAEEEEEEEQACEERDARASGAEGNVQQASQDEAAAATTDNKRQQRQPCPE